MLSSLALAFSFSLPVSVSFLSITVRVSVSFISVRCVCVYFFVGKFRWSPWIVVALVWTSSFICRCPFCFRVLSRLVILFGRILSAFSSVSFFFSSLSCVCVFYTFVVVAVVVLIAVWYLCLLDLLWIFLLLPYLIPLSLIPTIHCMTNFLCSLQHFHILFLYFVLFSLF